MTPLAHAEAPTHTGHVLLSTGIVLVVLLAIALVDRLREHRPAGQDAIVALACAVAGGTHLAVIPAHWQQDPAYGVFFAGTALAQLVVAAALLLRPHPRLLAAAGWGSAGLLALWLQTRLIAVPLGAAAGDREAFGALDLAAAAAELLVVGLAVRASRLARPALPAVPAATARWSG